MREKREKWKERQKRKVRREKGGKGTEKRGQKKTEERGWFTVLPTDIPRDHSPHGPMLDRAILNNRIGGAQMRREDTGRGKDNREEGEAGEDTGGETGDNKRKTEKSGSGRSDNGRKRTKRRERERERCKSKRFGTENEER